MDISGPKVFNVKTLPETNSSSLKQTAIFQPPIFRCKFAVSFRDCFFTPFTPPVSGVKTHPRGEDLGGFQGEKYSLKLTASLHLKMDGWNMIVSFWGPAYFQVRTVSLRECRECNINSYFLFMFIPIWGRDEPNLTSIIFQMGWFNRQLALHLAAHHFFTLKAVSGCG